MWRTIELRRPFKRNSDLRIASKNEYITDNISSEIIAFANAVYRDKVYLIEKLENGYEVLKEKKFTLFPQKSQAKKIENDLNFFLKVKEFDLIVDRRDTFIVRQWERFFEKRGIVGNMKYVYSYDAVFYIPTNVCLEAIDLIFEEIDPSFMIYENMEREVSVVLSDENLNHLFIAYYESPYLNSLPYVIDLFFNFGRELGALNQRHIASIAWKKKGRTSFIAKTDLIIELDYKLF